MDPNPASSDTDIETRKGRISSEATEALASLLAEALPHVDEHGRFSTEGAVALRRLTGQGLHPRTLPDTPVSLFGPWESLVPSLQRTLRLLVEEYSKAVMDRHPNGGVWEGLIRGGWELERYLNELGASENVREALMRGIIRLNDGPSILWRRMQVRSSAQRWKNDPRPSISDLLFALGRDPQWLLGDFAEEVAVDPRARGFYRDPGLNTTFGYVVGLDMLWTGEEMICLEGNLQRGIGDLRLDIQPAHPLEKGIVQAALDHSAKSVLWIEGHRLPLRAWFHESLRERGRDAGIRVDFMDDPRKRRCRTLSEGREIPRKGFWLESLPSDTLVVRRNEFPVGSDFVINDKEPFIRGLHTAFAESGETGVRVLSQTRLPPENLTLAEDGLPNLVYKYPDGLAGKEVFFLRAKDPGHALGLADEIDTRSGKGPGVFQRFVAPDFLPGQRVWDMSTEIFVSPVGVWFLGAIRREASKPVPRQTEPGIVEEPGALTSNMSTGGILTEVQGEELDRFREATLAVGEALRTVLTRTFQTRPPSKRGASFATRLGSP
jgi:hypothetical protein